MSADRWAALHDAIRWLDPVGTIALILIGAAVALRLSVVLIRRTLRAHAGRLMDEMRWQTLEPLMERAVRFVVYFTAVVFVVSTRMRYRGPSPNSGSEPNFQGGLHG